MPRILVADDNTNIQKMVALAFEERGIDVVSVGNGEAAVRRIPDLAPDLVLADVFMPVRNGYEVCEFVKKDERFSHVPVILLVGAFDPLDEKEARRVGADGVLKKPFIPPDPLIAMVTSALEKNPKLAAEMSKVREVPAASPEPAALAVEAPTRVEAKPLPEFPEPSPEEAATIYGFGKGRTNNEEPASPREDAQPEEEDFDGSSTRSDWRRNAANFEVPKEMGAFTPGEEFDSAMFPSESGVPPRHVPPEDKETAQRVAPSSPQVAESRESVAYSAVQPTTEQETESGEATPQAQSSASAIEQIGEAKPASAKEPEPIKAKAGSWLDMFATPAEYDEGSWMSTIFGAKSKAEKHEQKAEESAAKEETFSAAKSIVAAETIPAPKEPEEETQAAHGEPETAEPIFAESMPSASAPSTPSTPAKDSWLAPPPPPVLGSAPEPARAMPFAVSAEPPEDLLSAPADTPAVRKDSQLEEPEPPHFTPEPLLVAEEEPKGVSPFSGAPEQPEPLYEVSASPVHESSDEVPSEGPSAREELSSSIFAPGATAPVVNPEDERIPTVPPPNREALADIPFLMPSPPAELQGKASQPQDASGVNTDAIVAKLLEKLEPQLHEVLAQGLLKPLVENLLREELEKKR